MNQLSEVILRRRDAAFSRREAASAAWWDARRDGATQRKLRSLERAVQIEAVIYNELEAIVSELTGTD